MNEPCPNCKDPNPAIEKMSDGSCGVCGGTGTIEWKEVGKITSPNQHTTENHDCYQNIESNMAPAHCRVCGRNLVEGLTATSCPSAWLPTEKGGISMLRQWLNEDRITDPKKMVTNEEIATWLSNDNESQTRDSMCEYWYQKGLKEGRGEERQFILNVLDGVDIADENMGNTGGGTKAIRFALQSRIIDDKPQNNA